MTAFIKIWEVGCNKSMKVQALKFSWSMSTYWWLLKEPRFFFFNSEQKTHHHLLLVQKYNSYIYIIVFVMIFFWVYWFWLQIHILVTRSHNSLLVHVLDLNFWWTPSSGVLFDILYGFGLIGCYWFMRFLGHLWVRGLEGMFLGEEGRY